MFHQTSLRLSVCSSFPLAGKDTTVHYNRLEYLSKILISSVLICIQLGGLVGLLVLILCQQLKSSGLARPRRRYVWLKKGYGNKRQSDTIRAIRVWLLQSKFRKGDILWYTQNVQQKFYIKFYIKPSNETVLTNSTLQSQNLTITVATLTKLQLLDVIFVTKNSGVLDMSIVLDSNLFSCS